MEEVLFPYTDFRMSYTFWLALITHNSKECLRPPFKNWHQHEYRADISVGQPVPILHREFRSCGLAVYSYWESLFSGIDLTFAQFKFFRAKLLVILNIMPFRCAILIGFSNSPSILLNLKHSSLRSSRYDEVFTVNRS